jgi:hypothetical protein
MNCVFLLLMSMHNVSVCLSMFFSVVLASVSDLGGDGKVEARR